MKSAKRLLVCIMIAAMIMSGNSAARATEVAPDEISVEAEKRSTEEDTPEEEEETPEEEEEETPEEEEEETPEEEEEEIPEEDEEIPEEEEEEIPEEEEETPEEEEEEISEEEEEEVSEEEEEDDPEDEGEYFADGSFVITAYKKALNFDLSGEEFLFELKNEDGVVLNTVKNKADGSVTFDEIFYTQDDIYEMDEDGGYSGTGTKTVTYTVNEVIPDGAVLYGNEYYYNGYHYDATIYEINVMLTDMGDGTISAETASLRSYSISGDEYTTLDPDDPIVFTNSVDGDTFIGGPVSALVILRNGTLSGGEFTFVLKDGNGKILMRESNDASGHISFDLREYSFDEAQYGSLRYTVSQETGGRDDIIYDETVYNVTISPKGNDHYVIDKGGKIVFINEKTDSEEPGTQYEQESEPGTRGIEMLKDMALDAEKKLSASSEAEQKPENKIQTAAVTGDENSPEVWLLGIVLGAAALILLTVKRMNKTE